MDIEEKSIIAIQGRRTDISLLCYEVVKCDCCGRVQPHHADSKFPKKGSELPFERKAFVNQTFPAWHCTCLDYCKGSQFWPASRRSHIDLYCQKHDGKNPWDVLNCSKKSTNAVICHRCHSENSAAKDDHNKGKGTLSDMALARRYSSRNGFGPHIQPPPITPDEDAQITLFRELHTLMLSLTPAEESAIRRIAPMMTISKLTQGNIGSKGSTSCAFIDSKLSTLLPNLPSECKYIIILRNGCNGGAKSMKYKCARI